MPVFDGSKSETDYRASTYFSGSFTVSGEVGSDNNRYNVYVSFSNAKPKKSTYAIGYIIKADNGRAVYAYADGWEAQFMTDVDGWDDDVDADGTINMMACPKILSLSVPIRQRRDSKRWTARHSRSMVV